MKKRNYIKYFILLISIHWVQLAVAEEVGQVQYTRGAVIMQNVDGSSARLVGKNETVQRGEVIKTGPRSFTIVKLNDGTRMTIRPNSSFAVEKFNPKKDSTASALLRLFKGGLRTITGYISKQNPNGYRLRTGVATIGIRGTEFDTRLCQDDCDDENKAIEKNSDKQLSRTVARSVFVRGTLDAESIAGESRRLKAGSAIFEGDTLTTTSSSYAILVFRDKSRVSLQANTAFRVDEMKFDEEKTQSNSALFSLLRGGLRTVTGLIGKLKPDRYKMRTSVATIGIRGTGYDLLCTGACQAVGKLKSPTVVKLPEGEGLYANVWDGSIDFGGLVLSKDMSGYKSNKSSRSVALPTVPKFFRDNKIPKPDTIKVDESTLFSKVDTQDAPPGLYVSVTKGEVTVENKSGIKLDLAAGMASYTDILGRQSSQLRATPAFQKFDVYPAPNVANPEVINLNATSIGGENSGMVCEIK